MESIFWGSWKRIILTTVFICLFTLYLFSMVVHPYMNGGWVNLHSVWYAWQTLNAAIIALIASVFAIYASLFIVNRQKNSEFEGAKALLVDGLTELSYYFDECSKLLLEAHAVLLLGNGNRCELNSPLPVAPTRFREIFAKLISTGPKNLQNTLQDIILRLQISSSRLNSTKNTEFKLDSVHIVMTQNIVSDLLYLLEAKSLVNKLYSYARNETQEIKAGIVKSDLGSTITMCHMPYQLEVSLYEMVGRRYGSLED